MVQYKSNTFLKNKPDIEAWLQHHNIENFTLVPDKDYGYVVNVAGNVVFSKKDLVFIPVKFNEVEGSFDVSHNLLISLEFCPKTVRYVFDCRNNFISSWQFFPEKAQSAWLHNNEVFGDAQGIMDFDILLAKRQEWLIKTEHKDLDEQLKAKDSLSFPTKPVKI